MANVKNLKPIKKGQLSKEVAKKRGRLGGIKKAENSKRRKTIKECIEIFASLKPNDKIVKQLEDVGIAKDDANYLMAMVVGVSQKAMRGDTKAFKAINEFLGEDVKLNFDLEKHNEEMSLREREYKLREREIALREEELKHRIAIENGEVKESDKVFIVNDLNEIEKKKKHSKTK